MKLHIYTKENLHYQFEHNLYLINDEEFRSRLEDKELLGFLNSDDIIDLLIDEDWTNLRELVDAQFDRTINGVFDWEEKTCDYYEHFDNMLHYLICDLEYDTGSVAGTYTCSLSDHWGFDNEILHLSIDNFHAGMGEPEGAQLALDLVDDFMRSNKWHIAFFDKNKTLIKDVIEWSRCNFLDINTIVPVVWFGKEDYIPECWSITPETTDLFIKEFWGDYYEGALPHICKADCGLGIYYSVWEYGLDYDMQIFEDVKNSCPIDITLANVERCNALYNLIVSIYNVNKGDQFQSVESDLYLHDVVECNIILKNESFSYLYIKPSRFKLSKLNEIDGNLIEAILLEDLSYRESFLFLKDKVLENCSLESCDKVWEKTSLSLAHIQDLFNNGLICHIMKESAILSTVSYSVDIRPFIPRSELDDIVFIKSLINFLKRGCWRSGYFEASRLPVIYDEYARVIPQEGVYAVIWFNDSDEIRPKLGIWSAHSQYILSRIWESASSFCSHAFGNNRVHNNFRNNGHPLYYELDKVFEDAKAKCPIKIIGGKDPIDFNELEMFVKNLNSNPK